MLPKHEPEQSYAPPSAYSEGGEQILLPAGAPVSGAPTDVPRIPPPVPAQPWRPTLPPLPWPRRRSRRAPARPLRLPATCRPWTTTPPCTRATRRPRSSSRTEYAEAGHDVEPEYRGAASPARGTDAPAPARGAASPPPAAAAAAAAAVAASLPTGAAGAPLVPEAVKALASGVPWLALVLFMLVVSAVVYAALRPTWSRRPAAPKPKPVRAALAAMLGLAKAGPAAAWPARLPAAEWHQAVWCSLVVAYPC